MDIGSITDIITTIGFPIVSWGVLAWYIYRQDEQENENNKNWQTTIENNTKAITALTEIVKESMKG